MSETGDAATDRQAPDPLPPRREPTSLLNAAIHRQDDLRDMQAAWTHETLALRSELADEREKHAKELRVAEADRIDAIRAVDVGAVAAAAAVSATQATTLAAQVVASADAMRTQVAAVAQAATVAQNAALDPIQKDIADLRRAQYEAQGKTAQVVDDRGDRSDRRSGTNMWIGVIGVLVAMSVGFGSLIVAIGTYLTFHK